MTENEVRSMLNIIDGVYPNFVGNRSIDNILNSWKEIFKNMPADKVNKKLNTWIMNNSFPPTPNNLVVEDWKSRYE